jgi:hypothetical protein
VKHTETESRYLYELINLRYNKSVGGIFRLAKGKSPLIITNIMQHDDVILVQCVYLKSGGVQIYSSDKKVVPLKIGTFEDDADYISLEDKYEIQHLGCANWPVCDTEGCGEH